jgi:hypothetical protein
MDIRKYKCSILLEIFPNFFFLLVDIESFFTFLLEIFFCIVLYLLLFPGVCKFRIISLYLFRSEKLHPAALLRNADDADEAVSLVNSYPCVLRN